MQTAFLLETNYNWSDTYGVKYWLQQEQAR
jgi:endo-alpha-1,4-polygalactosaminidase (GH114 family)